jgi:cell wall-associated NlpC family hydrolase
MKRLRWVTIGAALALGSPVTGAAQSVGVEVGRFFQGEDWTAWRAGVEEPLLGPLSVTMYGTYLREASDIGERLWGGGIDLALFRESRQGAYALGGVAGGLAKNATDDFWGSWSVGAGYQILPASFLSLAAEARYQKLTPGGRDGVELSFRIGAVFGAKSRTSTEAAHSPSQPISAAEPATAVPLSTIGHLSPTATLADSVVATAAATMGTAYRLGGTTTEGFDCSGLIQYAYAQHGVSLPRVSADQARAGEKVDRNLSALEPGDILTFSSTGGPVTHVGLYVGEGRFIHSASRGVQLSLLSPDDPYGKWWYARWVGARRVIGR